MGREKTTSTTSAIDLASIVRGLYGRVARRLDLDPSYVSRVARGERRSEEVEAAIGIEIRQIMKRLGANHNGNGANSKNRDGKGMTNAKKKNKKVLQ